jgi:hypothetical protein
MLGMDGRFKRRCNNQPVKCSRGEAIPGEDRFETFHEVHMTGSKVCGRTTHPSVYLSVYKDVSRTATEFSNESIIMVYITIKTFVHM